MAVGNKQALALAAVAVALPLVSAAAPAGSRATREFVQAASASDIFEALEAQSALAQSSDPQVRGFANQMIKDHEQLHRSLLDAASRAGLSPPEPGISGDQAALLAALQSLRGQDFDKAYFRHQELAHRAALATVQDYVAHGDQPAVRAAAEEAVPIISHHLQMAEPLATP